ncbi:CbtB-domain containing protein [Rhizobium cremeum]|uniref:CbtB domain-containing protein n=1 Tax=Rhizobium cremeum TaxID=2813827 RepID=UPI000DDA1BFA|nr:CbtB-domain containing protein [Rhizobium cremeum]MCJ7996287.1 CbtB-domain containing protein [Rhizobium cremeum]MCJ8001546.1 CbtB-domain containing protein [Rhizobium cremeum]
MSATTITSSASSSVSRFAPALLSVFFGLFIVGFVGFSPMEVVHNAAHDARHANAFPCH